MPSFEIDISSQINDIRTLVGGKRTVSDPSMLGNMTAINHVVGTVSVSGIPEVIANWDRLSADMRDRAIQTMRDAATLIEIQSLIEVPYLTGRLQSAFFRDEEEIHGSLTGSGGPLRIYLGYDTEIATGDDGGSYAWRQHQDLDFSHSSPGTKARFLSDPFEEVSAEFEDTLSVDLKATIAGGLGAGTGGPRLRKKGV